MKTQIMVIVSSDVPEFSGGLLVFVFPVGGVEVGDLPRLAVAGNLLATRARENFDRALRAHAAEVIGGFPE